LSGSNNLERPMSAKKPLDMLVSYFPKKGKEKELLALIEKHWPILQRAGLSTDQPAEIWEASDKRSGSTYFVEKFQWADDEASDIAHQTPEVMAVWEPMGEVMD